MENAVYIGTDLPNEYSHSEHTNILKGANEKAKANAAQGLPELINTAGDDIAICKGWKNT